MLINESLGIYVAVIYLKYVDKENKTLILSRPRISFGQDRLQFDTV